MVGNSQTFAKLRRVKDTFNEAAQRVQSKKASFWTAFIFDVYNPWCRKMNYACMEEVDSEILQRQP